MHGFVGIRREDKNRWERRAPITPLAVRRLTDEHGIGFVVQPSSLRIFGDDEYEKAGARIDEDLSDCNIVMGVKEIPVDFLREGGAYLFFSHTIKAQPHNMAMLARIMERGCTLLDYELIVDDSGRRTVFFGEHAGMAGMGETLVALGQKLEARSVKNPFSALEQPYAYASLAAFEKAVGNVGKEISARGLPASLGPIVFGFAGYGNVSRGAQRIIDLMPVIEIPPDELAGLRSKKDASSRHVYKVVFKEEHMVEPLEGGFDLGEYYGHPDLYRGVMDRYLAHLDVLMNCIFWTDRYPRLLTRTMARDLCASSFSRLLVVGDISCDIAGAIEITSKATMPDVPCFTVDPHAGTVEDGVAAQGITVMAVDNLPCELSEESTRSFSDALIDLIPPMARATWSGDLESLGLARAIFDAIIVHRGKLRPRFEHLEEHARRRH